MSEGIRPRTQKIRNQQRAVLKKRRKQILVARVAAVIFLIVCIFGAAILIKKFGASKEKVNLDKYYGITEEHQLAVTIDNEVIGAKGIMFEYTESRHRPDRFAFSTMATRRKS